MTESIKKLGVSASAVAEAGVETVVEAMLREILDGDAGHATLRVTSASMRPRIQEGDAIVVVRAPHRKLGPGDVVVFRSDAVGLVVHRLLWRNHPLGQPTHIFTKGDAVGCLDRSVPVERVVGKVERIIRGEARYRPTTPLDRARCVWQAAGYGLRRWLRRRRRGSVPTNPTGNLECR